MEVFEFAFREDARFVHELPEGFQGFPPGHRGLQSLRTLRVFDDFHDLQTQALPFGLFSQGIGRAKAVRKTSRQGREIPQWGDPAEDEGVALQGGFVAAELGPDDALNGGPALRGDPGQDPLDEAVEDGR
jgi:hypothetical protein